VIIFNDVPYQRKLSYQKILFLWVPPFPLALASSPQKGILANQAIQAHLASRVQVEFLKNREQGVKWNEWENYPLKQST
jgi:hypothetical protein